MEFENILFNVKHGMVTVTVNRQKALNALNHKTLMELEEAFKQIQNTTEIRGAILTGAGEKSFISGADISELAGEQSAEERKNWFNKVHHIFLLMETLGKPVIAAVNGYALGGGCEMAMACTVRVASENASFGQPEVNLGLIPGYGGTQRLPRLVGKGTALELLLTGNRITAEEAYRIGLVNKVVPPNELIPFCEDMLLAIFSKGPLAVKGCLEAVHKGLDLSLQDSLRLEAEIASEIFNSEDAKEGLKAFLEKRKPVFKGK